MPHVSYIANGYCGTAGSTGEMAGFCELRFWNPTDRPTTVRMRVYYAARPPADLPEYQIGPGANPLLVFPQDYPEQFDDCGPWGMKLVSDTMLLADHILVAHRQGPPDNVKYRGGVGDVMVKTRPSRLWYFSDGIRLIHDPANAPFPFNEYEWYHVLNPNPVEARVTVTCIAGPEVIAEQQYTVGPERVLMWDNFEKFDRSIAFGIRLATDQPVVAESERIIYGLHGIDEWGAYIHCQRPGLPAPLEWNEDGA